NYPHFVSFDPDRRTIRLLLFAARIHESSQEQAFEIAFERHWSHPDVKEDVITDDPARRVRVHTGRLVCRYLRVLYLVESSPMLSSLVERKLVDAFGKFRSRGGNLVVDDYGSAFVAQQLLADVENDIRILSWQEAMSLPPQSDVVLFVDAIFRGRTLRDLI